MPLFRYSALTFNAHRIHYDLPYTRDVEGYPALVMNGGLTALLLVETARRTCRARIAGTTRAHMQPLFIGQSIAFNGRISAGPRPSCGRALRTAPRLPGERLGGDRRL